MNKYINVLALCVVLGTMTLHAYVPIVREGVEWGYFCGYVVKCYRIQFSGDTVINQRTYKKAWMYETMELDKTRWPGVTVCMSEEDGVVLRYINKHDYYDWYIQYLTNDAIIQEGPDGVIQRVYDFGSICADKIVGTTNIEGVERKYWMYTFCRNQDDGDIKVLEGAGPVNGPTDRYDYGNIVFPQISYVYDCLTPVHYLLYERRVDTGEIVYKSPMYDEFIEWDPTVVGIEGVRADVTERLLVTTDGLTVRSASADTPLTLYRADGSTAATGTGTVTAPAAGLYVVASPGAGSQKVMLR